MKFDKKKNKRNYRIDYSIKIISKLKYNVYKGDRINQISINKPWNKNTQDNNHFESTLYDEEHLNLDKKLSYNWITTLNVIAFGIASISTYESWHFPLGSPSALPRMIPLVNEVQLQMEKEVGVCQKL